MASEIGVGIGQGLARAGLTFSDALERVATMKQRRDRMNYAREQDLQERQRYHEKIARDDTWRRIQAEQMPGVSVGARPEGGFTGALRNLGKIGGEPVYYGEPEPETPTYNVSGLGVDLPMTDEGIEQGISLRRRMGLIGESEPQMPWEKEGFEDREAYMEYLRDRGEATREPESERRPTPTFGQALEHVVNPAYRTGSRQNPETFEMDPTYGLSEVARAAKADSLATGELTVPEFADRFEDRGGSSDPDTSDPDTAATDTAVKSGDPVEANEFLVNIVEAARGRGLDDAEIRRRLKRSGYSDPEIDAALEE